MTKGNRIYNVFSHKIIVSRDVRIDEDQAWNWENDEATSVEAEHQFVEHPIHTQGVQNVQDEVHEDTVNEEPEEENGEEDNDEVPPRGFRSLEDIYAHCNLASLEPENYFEALKSDAWRHAMEEELQMIEKSDTWMLVTQPVGKKVIGVKWVFKLKLNANGTVNKHKARLVVKGYSQEAGVDFFETFAPVARLDTIRLLLAIAAHKN